MRDLQIPASLDEIYDALQNIIALPVPYPDRFKISVLGDLKTQSFFDLENVSESGPKRDLQIDAKLTF